MTDFSATPTRIHLSTCSRLHLGFFNLSDHAEHQFGSMGVAVDAFQTSLTLSYGAPSSVQEPWIEALLAQQLKNAGITTAVNLTLQSSIPRHYGLGSGTQMALAISAAVQALQGKPAEVSSLAGELGRGGRSGIGIGTFAQGGLVIDGGKQGRGSGVPPLIARYAFPGDWCFLLILDPGHPGIHGQPEKAAFKTLTPQSLENTHALAFTVLLQAMPALVNHDFAAFAQAVAALQQYNAAYFSPAQGGMYASPRVAEVLNDLQQRGHVGLGQSSWGPTGFVLLPDTEAAEYLQQQLTQRFASHGLAYQLAHAVNHGADIRAD